MLFLGEERGEPEENGATQYAEAHQVDAVDAVKHGILAYGSHQSPECAGTEEAQVGDKRSFVIHFSLFLFKSSLFWIKSSAKVQKFEEFCYICGIFFET